MQKTKFGSVAVNKPRAKAPPVSRENITILTLGSPSIAEDVDHPEKKKKKEGVFLYGHERTACGTQCSTQAELEIDHILSKSVEARIDVVNQR